MDMDSLPPFMRYCHILPAQHVHGLPLKRAYFHEEDSPRERRLVKKEGGPAVGDWQEGAPPQDRDK